MTKIYLILFFVAISAVRALEEGSGEPVTDYPKEVLDGDVSLVTERVDIIGRQNEVDEESLEEPAYEVGEAEEETTALPLSEQGCLNPHEHYDSCGPRCQATCLYQPKLITRGSRAVCESIFSGTCHAGCFCDSGYVRFNDECVLPTECPTRTCGPNEDYTRQGTVCEITCESYKYIHEIEERCPKDLHVAGCFCKPGYVRNHLTGGCILPNRCMRSPTS